MIPSDKDRFECLKLAVSLILPRQGLAIDKLADLVVQAAEKFHKFVSENGAGNERG